MNEAVKLLLIVVLLSFVCCAVLGVSQIIVGGVISSGLSSAPRLESITVIKEVDKGFLFDSDRLSDDTGNELSDSILDRLQQEKELLADD